MSRSTAAPGCRVSRGRGRRQRPAFDEAGRMITLRTAVVLDGRSPAMKPLTMLVRLGLWRADRNGQAVGELVVHVAPLPGHHPGLPGGWPARRDRARHQPEPGDQRRADGRIAAGVAPAARAAYPEVGAAGRVGPAAVRPGAGADRPPLRAGPVAGCRLFDFSYPELGPALRDLLA